LRAIAAVLGTASRLDAEERTSLHIRIIAMPAMHLRGPKDQFGEWEVVSILEFG
jgi:hypothetical protein